MDLVLKYLPRVSVIDCRGHKNRVAVSWTVRYFAVLFPRLLISFQVFSADERPEIFNRGGVIYKCLPQECPGVGRLVGGAVPSGFVEEGEGRSEGSAQPNSGFSKGGDSGKFPGVGGMSVSQFRGEIIRTEDTKKCAGDAHAAGDQRNFVSGKSHAFLIAFFGWLAGVAFVLVGTRVFLWLVHGLPLSMLWEKPRHFNERRAMVGERNGTAPTARLFHQ